MVATKGGHRLVRHARVDRNGVRVENTGMEGYVFDLKIPLLNTIAPGLNETWQGLYPTVYGKLLTALEDRSTGDFVHPVYGSRTCKVNEFTEALDPDFRGGTVLSVQLWETTDDGDAATLSMPSASSIAVGAAFDLDAQYLPLVPPPDTGTPDGMSLVDFIKWIGTFADRAELYQMQWEAKINKVINAIQTTKEKYDSIGGLADASDRLIAALHALKAQALVLPKPTSYHVTQRNTTLGALANELKNPVVALMALNAYLGKAAVVPALTAVRYYT